MPGILKHTTGAVEINASYVDADETYAAPKTMAELEKVIEDSKAGNSPVKLLDLSFLKKVNRNFYVFVGVIPVAYREYDRNIVNRCLCEMPQLETLVIMRGEKIVTTDIGKGGKAGYNSKKWVPTPPVEPKEQLQDNTKSKKTVQFAGKVEFSDKSENKATHVNDGVSANKIKQVNGRPIHKLSGCLPF